MSKYLDTALIADEKIIFQAAPSGWALLWRIIGGIILLPLFGVGLIVIIYAIIYHNTTELAFTNKRVVAKFGFIGRRTIEMSITKVETIQVNQGIIGRLFNYGTLIVAGAGTPQAPIPCIANPLTFRRAFLEFQDRLRHS